MVISIYSFPCELLKAITSNQRVIRTIKIIKNILHYISNYQTVIKIFINYARCANAYFDKKWKICILIYFPHLKSAKSHYFKNKLSNTNRMNKRLLTLRQINFYDYYIHHFHRTVIHANYQFCLHR